MEYNPLTLQVRSRSDRLNELRESAVELTLQLAWHESFDPRAAAELATDEDATAASLAIEITELEKSLAVAKERAKTIRPATLLGWNPSYWLSEARSAAVRELAQHQAEVMRSEVDKRRYLDDQSRALARLANVQESLERYSKFDRSAVEDNLSTLETEISHTRAELEKWVAREKALDKQLEVPLREFLSLRSKLQDLQSDVDEAQRFERKLNQADNSYERKKVHDECKRRFDTGSPKEIIKRSERTIDGVKRNLAKWEDRLQKIGRRGAMDVRTLIIDGSNLCYEDDKLIGLSALRALCARLANDFEVIVVFDASIVDKLDLLSNDKLRLELPEVKVHVVASETAADETILDAAQDPNTFVVSNDRFADYSEKPAVRDDRIVRHEILNGFVFIHDLSVDVKFSN